MVGRNASARLRRTAGTWRRTALGCCAATVMSGLPATAAPEVELTRPAPFWPEVAALPRLVGTDPASRRINATLDQADERLKRAAAACARSSPRPHDPGGAWSRRVAVAARGPRFLSLVVHDVSFCGGAYPDKGTMALVFDLRSGRMVDWGTLLPPSVVQSTQLDGALDGGKIGLVSSDALATAYVRSYPAKAENGVAAADWSSCREAVGTSRSFVLWPAADPPGLAIEPADLPHVVAACGVRVVLPPAALRQLGVGDDTADALAAGR